MLLFLSIISICIASDSNNEDAYYQLIQQNPPIPQPQPSSRQRPGGGGGGGGGGPSNLQHQHPSIQQQEQPRSTFSMLNQAVSQVVHHELSKFIPICVLSTMIRIRCNLNPSSHEIFSIYVLCCV